MDVRNKIRNPDCTLCPLHEEAEHVCLMGDGPIPCDVMIVGEAPGAREDEEHKAFVGRAGQYLDSVLDEVGLVRSDVYITNVAKCRPEDNATPTRKEIKTCVEEYFWEEFEAVNPKFVLLLGNSALLGWTGRHSGIRKHRGTVFERAGVEALAAYHPAYILRNPGAEGEFKADLSRFARMVEGTDTEPETKTYIVRSTNGLRSLRARLMEATEIAFDLETTGLEEWREDAVIVTLGVSWKEGQAAVVPLWHKDMPGKWDPMTVLRYLKPALERKDCKYIAHNGKFDVKWLAEFGVFVPLTFDTMLAAHVIDENRSVALKPLSQVILGAPSYSIGDDVMDAYNAPLKRLCKYNAKDCDYTMRLYHIFRKELKSQPRLAQIFLKLMMPASKELARIEHVGIYAHEKRLVHASDQAMENTNKLRRIMHKYLPNHKRPMVYNDGSRGEEEDVLNFNSPQQVGEWLFGDLGLTPIELTAGGANSTKESVLLQLSKEHPAPKALLKYRKWQKYLSTYLLRWQYEDRDTKSRIHPNFKIHGTVTGRLSCERPNLQQVPRNPFIRSILSAPPGWRFVEADYSQIELRVAAMIADERSMIRTFASGGDIHTTTAREMLGKVDPTDEERKMAKAVNFGFLYGMGAPHFIEYARDKFDVEISEEESVDFRARFFEKWPAIKPWHERQRRLVKKYGRVQSPIGRVRHLPGIKSHDKKLRAEAERQAINSPVQSFASDVMLLSMIELGESLNPRHFRMVGTVHDSLLFEIREKAVDTVVPEIREIMETPNVKQFGAELTVPVEVEIKVGETWGGGKVWAKT